MMNRTGMRDPYQAPQADLRDARGTPQKNGSVPAAVLAGVVVWCALYAANGLVLMHFASSKSIFLGAIGDLRWLAKGIDVVTYLIVSYVMTRIAQGREWLVAGIFFLLKVAIEICFYVIFALMRTQAAYSLWDLMALGLFAICVVVGTCAGIWVNRKREKTAVIQ